ncbi:cytochrome P450 [Rhizoctonia solani]|nr:cytochrome P450 [Rhizoctonia solani]
MMDNFIKATVPVLAALALIIRLSYSWLLLRPIPNIPHNLITSVLDDIPAIVQHAKDGKELFTEFVAHDTCLHGPISQVGDSSKASLGGEVVAISDRLKATFATALLNNQISLPASEKWKKHRRLAGPSMSRRYLERMFGRITLGANKLVGLWQSKYALVGSSAFDVALDFHLVTMDNIVLVKYLPTDPKIQRQLRDEICILFGADAQSNDTLDFNLLDDPERVPVFEAIVAETMRCAAVGPSYRDNLSRMRWYWASLFQKLLFTTDPMSKDESEWGPDAKEWRPRHWLASDGSFNRLAGPSIPFCLGQRSCFGQRLAILQLKTYLATMSRAFFFKPVPPEATEAVLRFGGEKYLTRELGFPIPTQN